MEATYSEKFTVCTWDVDYKNRLTMAAVFNYFQEVAGEHATRLGVGKDLLQQKNLAWVLSRMSVVLFRRPSWREKIVVETWPRGTNKLFAVRDYAITDEMGAPVAQARSGWLLIDVEKMRPLRPQVVTEGLPTNQEKPALEDGLPTLGDGKALELVETRRALYSDIDYNGHVNNARYVQWIQDIFSLDLWQDVERLRFDINYISEVKPGERIAFYRKDIQENGDEGGPASTRDISCPWPVGRITLIEGRHEGTQQPAFRAELRFGL